MVRLSILDYSLIDEGTTPNEAFYNTTRLAKHAEALGYHRFWLAEHHNVLSVGGSSPEMLMMHVATSTETIRIGSGGVMLPHYAPYKVAENFKIMSAIHPGRIDLGIGRSPSFKAVNNALNKEKTEPVSYEDKIDELHEFLNDNDFDSHKFGSLIATPQAEPPETWLLGTSDNSAVTAANRGMNYSFALFGKPERAENAINRYRSQNDASRTQGKVMISLLAVIGETAEEAEEMAQSLYLWLLFIEGTRQPKYFPSTRTAAGRGFSEREQEKIEGYQNRMVVGDAKMVAAYLEQLSEHYNADEIMIIPNMYGIENRLKGLELLSDEMLK